MISNGQDKPAGEAMLEEDKPLSPLFARIKRLAAMPLWHRETVPWAIGAVEYTERYWSLTREAWRWRIAFALSLGVNVTLGACLAYVATSSRVVPYIVQVDQHGYAVAIKPATESSVTDASAYTNTVAALLSDWVINMRSVLGDRHEQNERVNRVFAMLSAGTPATRKVNDWYRAHDPLRGTSRRVTVDRVHVEPMSSPNMRKIEWTETAREGSASGETSRFAAFVKFRVSPLAKEEEVLRNPIGLFVTDVSITQLQ